MQHFLPNGQILELRQAVPDDAPVLLSYFRQLISETDFLLYTRQEAAAWTVEEERDFILSFSKEANDLLLIAFAGNQLIGTLSIRQNTFWKEAHLGNLGIGVLHSYWNMGIARRMMTAGTRWAEQHPELEIIQLSVVANNERAIQLYRNFGFMEYGRMPKGTRQPDGSYVDNILMSKRVKPL
ncbi:GNAT family N-acetyltransferase [Chitinophaga sp.]|uniref:GNAT family N-acetyltransferase n=1 Tax=Chitinophaga sp. TaxID=1869181 RepID=UPI0031D4FC6C